MNYIELETVLKETQENTLRQIENRHQDNEDEIFHLTFQEASYIQKQMKQLPLKEGEAFFLQVQRRPDQTLFKPAIRDTHQNSFENEEQASYMSYVKSLQLGKKKIDDNEFNCILTLQLLCNDPLSIYFKHVPNTIFLKMADYYDRILKPLDMSVIWHRLYRGEYVNTLDEFQLDMVTMIHNARVYFVDNDEMFQVSILFEQLFWQIYKEEIPKYTKANQEFKGIMGSLRPKVNRRRLKRYSINQRKQINATIQKQPKEVQAKISKLISPKYKAIDIDKLPKSVLAEIEKMFVPIDDYEDNPVPLFDYNEAIRNMTIEDIENALGSDEDD